LVLLRLLPYLPVVAALVLTLRSIRLVWLPLPAPHTHTHTHILLLFTHIHIYTHIATHTHTFVTHTHIYIYIYTHIVPYTHTHTFTYTHTHTLYHLPCHTFTQPHTVPIAPLLLCLTHIALYVVLLRCSLVLPALHYIIVLFVVALPFVVLGGGGGGGVPCCSCCHLPFTLFTPLLPFFCTCRFTHFVANLPLRLLPAYFTLLFLPVDCCDTLYHCTLFLLIYHCRVTLILWRVAACMLHCTFYRCCAHVTPIYSSSTLLHLFCSAYTCLRLFVPLFLHVPLLYPFRSYQCVWMPFPAFPARTVAFPLNTTFYSPAAFYTLMFWLCRGLLRLPYRGCYTRSCGPPCLPGLPFTRLRYCCATTRLYTLFWLRLQCTFVPVLVYLPPTCCLPPTVTAPAFHVTLLYLPYGCLTTFTTVYYVGCSSPPRFCSTVVRCHTVLNYRCILFLIHAV